MNQDSKECKKNVRRSFFGFFSAHCRLLILQGKSLTVVSVDLLDLKINTQYLKFMIGSLADSLQLKSVTFGNCSKTSMVLTNVPRVDCKNDNINCGTF